MDSSGFEPKGRHPFASMNWIRFDGCYLSQADCCPTPRVTAQTIAYPCGELEAVSDKLSVGRKITTYSEIPEQIR